MSTPWMKSLSGVRPWGSCWPLPEAGEGLAVQDSYVTWG